MASLTEHCGGLPKIMSITKVHDAFNAGTIDVVMTGIVAVGTRGLWQVADTITRTNHASIEFLVIVNERTWQKLSDRQQAIILSAAKKAERDARQKSLKLEEKAYEFARSKGMKVRDLTPDQVAEWRACSAEVVELLYGKRRGAQPAIAGRLRQTAHGPLLQYGASGRLHPTLTTAALKRDPSGPTSGGASP